MSDVDTATVDSLKALDPNRPIREGDIRIRSKTTRYSITSSARAIRVGGTVTPIALRRHHIDHQIELGRLLDGNVRRFLASENLIDECRGAPKQLWSVGAIGHQAADLGKSSDGGCCRQAVRNGEVGHTFGRQAGLIDYGVGLFFHHAGKTRFEFVRAADRHRDDFASRA